MNTLQKGQIDKLMGEVRTLLAQARQATAHAVNTAMVTTYWMIGQRIVVEEQNGSNKAAYGEQILQKLSSALEKEFGNGFSYSNLINMRQFYLTYPDKEICYTMCSKLSWSHNRLIMRVQNTPSDIKEKLKKDKSIESIRTQFVHTVINERGEEQYTLTAGSQSEGTKRTIGIESAVFLALQEQSFLFIDVIVFTTIECDGC